MVKDMFTKRWPLGINLPDGRYLVVDRVSENQWALSFKGEGVLLFDQPPQFTLDTLKHG